MIRPGRALDWTLSPLAALQRWPADRPVMMLHSGRFDARWSRWSILAEPRGAWRFEDRTGAGDEPMRGASRWIGPAPSFTMPVWQHRPFRDLRSLLAASGDTALWLGYLGYDLGRWIEHLPRHAAADRDWPMAMFAHCPSWLVYDGLTGRWHACGDEAGHPLPPLPRLPEQAGRFDASPPQSAVTPSAYCGAVERVRQYIAAGDVFQVNLAQRFTAAFAGEPPLAGRALYQRLAQASPAWYGAYLELPHDPAIERTRRVIASISPELFLQVQSDGRVITRPIKGTRPASVNPDELRHSIKDTAELHMIVDLLRNDLGRVCDYGSVRVIEPRAIESHPTVHHGVATIEGQLHRTRDLVDLLRATLPGGSITGAPKVRAMQIIDELEPVRRGPYCGAIGVMLGQAAWFNLAIRTLCIEPDAGRLDFSVGGGIVADSQPQAEYQETLDKAAAMLAALQTRPPSTDPAEH